MRKPFKDYTKKELDKLMYKKWIIILEKHMCYFSFTCARNKLFEWYESKLKLIK